MKPKVYIETSVISYLTARASRDVVVAGHQQATQTFWARLESEFDPFVSSLVVGRKRMKDPIVEEVRKYRMEHTQRFGGDLHRICEDLRKKDQTMKDRLVRLSPRKLSVPKQLCVAEEPAEYKTKPGNPESK